MNRFKQSWCAAVLSAAAVGSLAGSARAAYVKTYDANSAATAPDPASVAGGGWLLGGVTPASPVKVAGSDGTGNFWQVTDTNTNPTNGAAQNNSVAYSIQTAGAGSDPALASAFTDPNGWQFSVNMKVLNSTVSGAGAGTAPTWVDIRTDPDGGVVSGRIYSLAFFQNDPTFGNGVYWGLGGTITAANLIRTMDLSDAFHTFSLVYTPDPLNSANNAVNVYIDGETTPAFTRLESEAGTSGAGRVQIAQAASGAQQTVQYRSFSFQTVPEPATLGVGLAGLGLLGLRLRRRSV